MKVSRICAALAASSLGLGCVGDESLDLATDDQALTADSADGTQMAPADYDGDGKADLGFKTLDGHWRIDLAKNGFGRWDESYPGFGDSRFHAVPADYDGDLKA